MILRRLRESPRARIACVLGASFLLLAGVATAVFRPTAFTLQKLAGMLVMPAGIVWLAILALAAHAAWTRGRRACLPFLAIWVAYSLAGSPIAGQLLMGLLDRHYWRIRPLAEKGRDASTTYDAVFVLGGGTRSTRTGEVALTDAGDRVVLAARLYHAGKTPVLVCSGMDRERSLAAETRRVWVSLGIPREAIVELDGPRNTSEEIAAYKDLVERRGWKRAGLVTSSYHMRRAMKLCRKAGLDLRPLPAATRGNLDLDSLTILSFIPQRAGFQMVELACWEIVGALVGR